MLAFCPPRSSSRFSLSFPGIISCPGSRVACFRRLFSGSRVVRFTEDPGRESAHTTYFGFQEVPIEQKARLVGDVFHRVANHYDLMNDLMSAGVHRWWKNTFVNMLHPLPGMDIIDVAGGTGDIAFRIVNRIRSSPTYFPRTKASKVLICDINPSMLEVGRARADTLRITAYPDPVLEWLVGDAENLPVASEAFDAYTIAFGIRNCTHIYQVLKEAHRVLRPGGRFLCLEFSHVNNAVLRNLYDQYSFGVIPVLGQIVAGDRQSYQYLVESIRRFPDQNAFADMIRAAGFKKVTHTSLTFGVVAIHSGFKL